MDLTGTAERTYHTPEPRGGSQKELPRSKERWLGGHRMAERRYSTFKVRRGGSEEIPLITGKEQRLCFPGAAMNRHTNPR